MEPGVVAAVRRDLDVLAKRDGRVVGSALAASALALAAEIDAPDNSATSKSMCARALLETMDRLRALVPDVSADDRLDELAGQRSKRLRAVAG